MKVLGRTEQENARMIVSELNLPVPPELYMSEVKSVVLQLLKNATTMPGTKTDLFFGT